MNTQSGKVNTFTDWFLSESKNDLIQDVPSNVAHCEFDCQVLECNQEHWDNCERRLSLEGASAVTKPAARD